MAHPAVKIVTETRASGIISKDDLHTNVDENTYKNGSFTYDSALDFPPPDPFHSKCSL